MNQLYHPERSVDFFDMLAASSIPVFTVTNNAVHDLTTFSDKEKKARTLEGVTAFLASNGLGASLRALLCTEMCLFPAHGSENGFETLSKPFPMLQHSWQLPHQTRQAVLL